MGSDAANPDQPAGDLLGSYDRNERRTARDGSTHAAELNTEGHWEQTSGPPGRHEPPTHTVTYTLQANWNMISLPVMPDSSNPSDVFGNLPSGWLLYAWDAANGRYLGKDLIVLNQEEAYWLKVSTSVSYPVTGKPNGAAQTEIDLALGWNMIGVPYESPIPWFTVQVSKEGNPPVSLDQAVASNWIQGTFFRWSGSAYEALTSTSGGSFLPLSGYWAKAKMAGLQLILPKP